MVFGAAWTWIVRLSVNKNAKTQLPMIMVDPLFLIAFPPLCFRLSVRSDELKSNPKKDLETLPII
jgi:hypothetical protein